MRRTLSACGIVFTAGIALLGLGCGATTTARYPSPNTGTSAAISTPNVSGQKTTPPAGGDLTVNIKDSTTMGKILTNSSGRTLYRADFDSMGMSNCTGSCTQDWPPLLFPQGDPKGPEGIGGELKTFNRTDGGRQVMYNDSPLYYYAADTQPGDTKGEGMAGVWHVAQLNAPKTQDSSKGQNYNYGY